MLHKNLFIKELWATWTEEMLSLTGWQPWCSAPLGKSIYKQRIFLKEPQEWLFFPSYALVRCHQSFLQDCKFHPNRACARPLPCGTSLCCPEATQKTSVKDVCTGNVNYHDRFPPAFDPRYKWLTLIHVGFCERKAKCYYLFLYMIIVILQIWYCK